MNVLLATILLSTVASGAYAATEYSGDRIDGVPVINRLDVDDLEPGKLHRFYLQGADSGIGQHWFIPVIVAKGAGPGKTLGLQTGVHGDEINGTQVVHRLFERLDPAALNGNVIAVVAANSTGILANSRYFQLQGDSGGGVDFNRIWPGKENGNAAERHAWHLFNGVWKDNADIVVDLHTQSTGTTYPLYIYADYRVPGVKDLAELVPADMIKIDTGEPAAAEQAFNDAGMISITLEVGGPKVYQPELIARALTGIDNMLKHYGLLAGKPGRTAKEQKTFIGNQTLSIRARQGGFAEILVALGQEVKAGQELALQRNGFGEIVARYTAPEDGRVASLATDPVREPGSLLVRLIRHNPDIACRDGC